jgi:hypothetical protein
MGFFAPNPAQAPAPGTMPSDPGLLSELRPYRAPKAGRAPGPFSVARGPRAWRPDARSLALYAQIKVLGPRLTGSVEVESGSIREVWGYTGYTVLRTICNPHVTQKRKRT